MNRRSNGRKVAPDEAPTPPRPRTDAPYSRRQQASAKATRKLRLITAQALDGRTRASQQFNKIVKNISDDLGGADRLSEVEKHLVTSFAGAAILQGHQLTRLLAGEVIDPHEYGTLTVALIRSATRLGTGRRAKDVTPSVDEYLEHIARKRGDYAEDDEAA